MRPQSRRSFERRIGVRPIRSSLAITLFAAATIIAPPAAALVPVIDQAQTTADSLLGTFRELDAFAQSFVPSFENVAGAGLIVGTPADPSNPKVRLTLELWASLGGPGQPLVAVEIEARPLEWADAFWQPVTVNPGGEYFLVFRNGTPQVAAPLGANGNLYPAGVGFFSTGGPFEPVAGFDFAFRTYADPIPEPRTYALLLAGLAAILFRFRKRRAI